MALGEEIERLYGLPLEEFTAARNEVARRLRREGRRKEAEEVSTLQKPSVAAWVVNRLARERSADMLRLLQAGEAIKAGRRGADERFREAAEQLTGAGREILERAGRPGRDTVLQEVATTLRAAVAEEPELLKAGRLTRGIEASGFEAALAGAELGAAANATSERSRAGAQEERGRRIDEARRSVSEARAEARRLRRVAAAAEAEALRARTEAERAERRLEDAERRLAAARES